MSEPHAPKLRDPMRLAASSSEVARPTTQLDAAALQVMAHRVAAAAAAEPLPLPDRSPTFALQKADSPGQPARRYPHAYALVEQSPAAQPAGRRMGAPMGGAGQTAAAAADAVEVRPRLHSAADGTLSFEVQVVAGDLGPLSCTIAVRDGVANAWFASTPQLLAAWSPDLVQMLHQALLAQGLQVVEIRPRP